MRLLGKILLGLIILVALLIGAAVIFAYFDGQEEFDPKGEYVALGSSYAAAPGLGDMVPNSPRMCQRTQGGYPELLAPMVGMSLVNASCSGATAQHVAEGGQMMMGPQVDAVGPNAKLVTITAGGNDVNFIGDMMRVTGQMGLLGRFMPDELTPFEGRDFAKAKKYLLKDVAEVRKRAPDAQIALVTYPTVLPREGTCDAIMVIEEQADLFRKVEARLRDITREAASESGAMLIDVAEMSMDAHSCSDDPWIAPAVGGVAAFHPTKAGAERVAKAVAAAVNAKNQGQSE